jgi:hypothetical protein
MFASVWKHYVLLYKRLAFLLLRSRQTVTRWFLRIRSAETIRSALNNWWIVVGQKPSQERRQISLYHSIPVFTRVSYTAMNSAFYFIVKLVLITYQNGRYERFLYSIVHRCCHLDPQCARTLRVFRIAKSWIASSMSLQHCNSIFLSERKVWSAI